MARLPVVGGDDGNWGDILNDFLLASHAEDGTLRSASVASAQLADNAVTNTQLADNAVATASVQDGVITEAKLSSALQTKLNATPAAVEGAVDPERAAGIVAWWRFDEQSGVAAVDASGFGHHGRIAGGAMRVAGIKGTALQLNGTSRGATVANSPLLSLPDEFSISAWVRPSASATQAIVKKAANASVNGYELTISSSGRPFFRIHQVESGDTYRIDASSPIPTDNSAWTHVAATYNSATRAMYLYINGVQAAFGTGPTGVYSNDLPLVIGSEEDGLYPFTGLLDDVRLYDMALSAIQVTTIVNE